DFQIPAQRQQGKNPEIVAPQPAADSFPFGNGEMWRDQIGCQVFRPGLVSRNTFRREQLRKVSRLDYAHSARPDLVVTITARLHQQKDRDQYGVNWNNEMRIALRTKNE